jgi:hypothetical protein
MTALRPLTVSDVVAAMELADDHALELVRAKLPDGIECAVYDGRLYLDPDVEVGRYARLLVEGVKHVVDGKREEQQGRPDLRVVPDIGPMWRVEAEETAAG